MLGHFAYTWLYSCRTAVPDIAVPHTWAGSSPWLAAHIGHSVNCWPPRVIMPPPPLSNQSVKAVPFTGVISTFAPFSHCWSVGWLALYFSALVRTACTPWLMAHCVSRGAAVRNLAEFCDCPELEPPLAGLEAAGVLVLWLGPADDEDPDDVQAVRPASAATAAADAAIT
jgi:hypothetical protein